MVIDFLVSALLVQVGGVTKPGLRVEQGRLCDSDVEE
jgi:hypothetical protein